MSFPKDFLFGAATASYQIEGGWNSDGKGENIWDRICHTQPEKIKNMDTGDVACDSYYLYKQDVQLLKDIGFQVYRFSLSWARILPNGDLGKVNSAGITYYHNLIDELLQNGIQPLVTLYHWDLPQKLQDMGGWLNPLIADYFEDFADLVFKTYGSKVKWWITINEPIEVVKGYSVADNAPLLALDSPANYIVAHNLLRAHAKAYRLYDNVYRAEQKGKISITINANAYFEKTKNLDDIEATKRAWTFNLEWFTHPVYSEEGDYPPAMRKIVDDKSRTEGRIRSRLPRFTAEEIKALKGSHDFFGLNHYTSKITSCGTRSHLLSEQDANVTYDTDPKWPSSNATWLKVVPEGFRELLCFIKDNYNNPPVFITENGYCSTSDLNDDERISYYKSYLKEMLNAMNVHGCNVIGYTAWSLLDNFEWLDGYAYRFGLVHVDFENEKRKRTPKKSAEFFKKMLKERAIPDD